MQDAVNSNIGKSCFIPSNKISAFHEYRNIKVANRRNFIMAYCQKE